MKLHKQIIAIAATILLSSISFAQKYSFNPTLRAIYIEKKDGRKFFFGNPKYNSYNLKTSTEYCTFDTAWDAFDQYQRIVIICKDPGYEKCRLNTAISDTLQYGGVAIPMGEIDKQTNELLNKIDRKLRWGTKQGFITKNISINVDGREFVFSISANYQGNKKGDATISVLVRDTVRKEFQPPIIDKSNDRRK